MRKKWKLCKRTIRKHHLGKIRFRGLRELLYLLLFKFRPVPSTIVREKWLSNFFEDANIPLKWRKKLKAFVPNIWQKREREGEKMCVSEWHIDSIMRIPFSGFSWTTHCLLATSFQNSIAVRPRRFFFGFPPVWLRTWYWVSESDIWEVAVDAEIVMEAKTFEVAADAEDAEGNPIVAEDDDPMVALTGCRLVFRFPTSWNDIFPDVLLV